jgi:4-amino-4-deoxy-L-arabinose transferase-like glycosyltransferase
MKSASEARAGAPRWAWALALLALTAPFWSLSHPLIEVDDARYAEVPREMLATGDWATPHLDYMDYVEKPPLWYWLCASSYTVFGVGEAQARLPLALLSALGLLLTLWLGAWLYDQRAGLLGASALGSCGLYFFLSHYITLDLLLTVTLLAETALILRCVLRPQDARWAAPAAWAAAGLAFMSKGLVALVLPGVWACALFALWPKRRRAFLSLLSPLGAALFAAIVVPWFWLMERRHPGFLRFIFLEQHFQRFTTAKYNRQSPFWFFLAVLPAGMLPWAPAALASLARAPRRWLEREGDAALALWAVIVTGFFSVSHSKLATYILPVLPHLSLLAARAADEELPAWSRWLSSLLGAVLLGAAAAAWRLPMVPRELLPWAPVGAAALGAALLAGGVARAKPWRAAALAMGGLSIGACLLVVLRHADGQMSVKSAAQAIALQAGPDDEVWVYDLYPHGLSFYLGRRVDKVVNWLGELDYAKRDPANAARFGDDSDVESLPLPGKRVFVLLPAKVARQFISMTPQGAISDHGRFGKWELTIFVPEEQLPRLKERPQPSDELPGTRRRRRRRRR